MVQWIELVFLIVATLAKATFYDKWSGPLKQVLCLVTLPQTLDLAIFWPLCHTACTTTIEVVDNCLSTRAHQFCYFVIVIIISAVNSSTAHTCLCLMNCRYDVGSIVTIVITLYF